MVEEREPSDRQRVSRRDILKSGVAGGALVWGAPRLRSIKLAGALGSPGPTTTTQPAPQLVITKTGPSDVFPGAEFDFTIVVENLAGTTAFGVIVEDDLPSQGSFVSSVPPVVPSNGQLVFTPGDLHPSESATFTVRWQAPPLETVLSNTATITSPGSPGSATEVVPVTLQKTSPKSNAVAAGTGLRNRGKGTITIPATAIPADKKGNFPKVTKAILCWTVLYSDPKQLPKGKPTIRFENVVKTADYASGQEGPFVWGDRTNPLKPIDKFNIGYAVDVTTEVQNHEVNKKPNPNGPYKVADATLGGFAQDAIPVPVKFPDTDGASLVVIFDDPKKTVVWDFTYESNNGKVVSRKLTGFTSNGAVANLILAGSDGQFSLPDLTTITGYTGLVAHGPGLNPNIWVGRDPQLFPRFGDGDMQDTFKLPLALGVFPKGSDSLTVELENSAKLARGDNVGLNATVLIVQE